MIMDEMLETDLEKYMVMQNKKQEQEAVTSYWRLKELKEFFRYYYAVNLC